MSKKSKGCLMGLTIGGIVRAFIHLMSKLIQGITWVLAYFGLWIPFLYALGGVLLFLIFNFNPFNLSDINALLYIVGFFLCVLAAIVITIRKLIIKPLKKLFKKHDDGKNDDECDDKKSKESAPETVKSVPQNQVTAQNDAPRNPTPLQESNHFIPQRGSQVYLSYADGSVPLTPDEMALNNMVHAERQEKPKIYFSAVEPDTLIHEYSNRYEVFKVADGRKYFIKTEYKNDDEL